MKLLLDENVPMSMKKSLKDVGHDVEHINTRCKGKNDIEVLDYAYNNKRVIVSLDSDFCGFKKKEHYGIIKLSGKINNPTEALIELLKKEKGNSLENIYFQIDSDKAYKEVKKYSKKRKTFFKHFQRIYILGMFKQSLT